MRAGTIISITPGSDSCNAMVGFLEPVAIGGDGEEWTEALRPGNWQSHRVLGDGRTMHEKVPRMAVWDPTSQDNPRPRYRVALGEAHGAQGPAFALFECADYCAVNELAKVDLAPAPEPAASSPA